MPYLQDISGCSTIYWQFQEAEGKIERMVDALTPLILDFLEWLEKRPRPYAEVMDAWRTSCPRLPVWEEATDNGFVTRRPAGQGSLVELTERGAAFLALHRRPPAAESNGHARHP
jgi:hypothetical protein